MSVAFSEFRHRLWRFAAPLPFLAALPALTRLLSIYFVDQRYQVLMPRESRDGLVWPAAAFLLAATLWGARWTLRRYGDGIPLWRSIFFAFLPLLPLSNRYERNFSHFTPLTSHF